MNYEIVTLEEKIIAGLTARTGNSDPNCPAIIGGLWQKFMEENIVSNIKKISSPYTIGLYSDYDSQTYDVTVGMTISLDGTSDAKTAGLSVKTIPAGKYAKFAINGNVVTAVQDAWNKIWQMPLERSYTADFEEYLNHKEDNTADINIYVALK